MKSMILALAAASIGVAGNASAATIVWSKPTTDTGTPAMSSPRARW